MPLETALYVPKIVAIAIVARNRAVFGLEDLELDPAVSFDKVAVRSGVSMQSVALAAGTSTDKVAELNPQMLANRAPPVAPGAAGDVAWTVRVPVGTAPKAAKSLPKFAEAESKLERYVVRWGESLEDIANRRHSTRSALASLNGLRREEVMRPGTVLFVPARSPDDAADPFSDVAASRPFVVAPALSFSYPDRRRVFYRIIPGDTLRDVASLFGVSADDLCRWNGIDPGAALHDGMTLQAYAPAGQPRGDVLVLEEKDAQVLAVGSPEFFAHFESLRGRTRIELVAKQGDTWRTIAHHHGLSVAQLERINGRARSSPLNPGDKLVVYVSSAKAGDAARGDATRAIAAKHAPAAAEEKAPDAVAGANPFGGTAGDEGGGAREEGVKPAALLREPEAPQPPR